MALATRELELIIIARDRTSAVLARVGGALAILGAGAARLGAEGVGFFVGATGEAIEFRRQVALAFTQVEIAGVTFDDTLNLIRESARRTAVPLEEVTEVAFDIFSTLTLDRIEQAQELLDAVNMTAVAGQAPARDIGRAVIGWVNALNIANPTAADFSRILDVQFELYRKGAGTFAEFGGVVGKAVPAFVAANQGINEMGASLSFLTRNRLTPPEAATSAARFVELLYGPKAIVGLDKVGIALEDINGKFLPMDEVLTDIVAHFKGLSDSEKKLEFKEIFGQGRIQARRFFDLLLKEGNFEEFLFLLDSMRDSAGVVRTAFDIMMLEPAVQLDILKNRFVILRQEIGDVFIPLLVGTVLPVMDRLLDFWEDLDDIQKENLVKWAAFSTLWLTIGGSIAAVTGGLLLILGLLKAFTGSIVLAGILAGGFALGISAIAAAVALAIIDWDKFVEIFGPWWDKILEKMEPVVEWLKEQWPEAWDIAEDAYQTALLWFQEEWPVIWEDFKSGVSDWLENDWPIIWENAKSAVTGFVDFFKDLWNERLREPLNNFIAWAGERWELIWADLKEIFEVFINEDWQPLWDEVVKAVEDILPELGELIITLGALIIGGLGVIIKIASVLWDAFGEHIVEAIRIAVALVAGMIEAMLQNLTGLTQIITGLLTLNLPLAITGLTSLVQGNATVLSTAWSTTGDAFDLQGDIIEDILYDTEGDVDSFVDNALADIKRFKDKARADAFHIRNSFAIMSPGQPFSPPLTKQFADSMRFMQDTLGQRMEGMLQTTQLLGPRIRDSLGELTQPAQVRPRSLIPLTAGIPLTTDQPSIGQQINIAKLESTADPFEIAAEIGWHALNS